MRQSGDDEWLREPPGQTDFHAEMLLPHDGAYTAGRDWEYISDLADHRASHRPELSLARRATSPSCLDRRAATGFAAAQSTIRTPHCSDGEHLPDQQAREVGNAIELNRLPGGRRLASAGT